MLERLVVFGASGDLTSRLVAPGLVQLHAAGELDRLSIVGVGLEEWSDEQFAEHLAAGLDEQDDQPDPASRSWLLANAGYRCGDVTDPSDVAAAVAGDGPVVAYLALPPAVFRDALAALADAGLPAGSVIVVEKPFGRGLEDARALNRLVDERFGTDVTVFRNDHFLHSQTVQNLLGLRFANRVWEPLWRRGTVTGVDVTWDETLTLEGRAGYYDHTGALRDMLQNHLLQVLCFAAMEPPASLAGRDLHRAREQLLRSVETPDRDWTRAHSLRARYAAGTVQGRSVPDYTHEDGVDPARGTETFAQLTLAIDSWRWSQVPVTLRSGKAMAEHVAEVVVTFDDVPHAVFASQDGCAPNQLRVGLRPPSLSLTTNVNAEGELFGLTPVRLDTPLPAPALGAYAGLLRDVLVGDTSLAVSAVEAEEGWRIVDPVLAAWQDDVVPLREYEAGAPLPADWDTR